MENLKNVKRGVVIKKSHSEKVASETTTRKVLGQREINKGERGQGVHYILDKKN